jgi:hypothetical protein
MAESDASNRFQHQRAELGADGDHRVLADLLPEMHLNDAFLFRPSYPLDKIPDSPACLCSIEKKYNAMKCLACKFIFGYPKM